MDQLKGKHIAILVANGFEQVELTEPKKALERVGATTAIVSPERKEVKGWKHTEWGDTFAVDAHLGIAKPKDYHGLLLPGGVMNPDTLRADEQALDFARHFVDAGKPIAAICHGPWLLVEIGMAKGRTLTSYKSIKTDLQNAGANWVDEEVVVDRGLVTSRHPGDLRAFNAKIIEVFAEVPRAP